MGLLQAILRPVFKRLPVKQPEDIELAKLFAKIAIDPGFMPELLLCDFIRKQENWTSFKEVKKHVDHALAIVNVCTPEVYPAAAQFGRQFLAEFKSAKAARNQRTSVSAHRSSPPKPDNKPNIDDLPLGG